MTIPIATIKPEGSRSRDSNVTPVVTGTVPIFNGAWHVSNTVNKVSVRVGKTCLIGFMLIGVDEIGVSENA